MTLLIIIPSIRYKNDMMNHFCINFLIFSIHKASFKNEWKLLNIEIKILRAIITALIEFQRKGIVESIIFL